MVIRSIRRAYQRWRRRPEDVGKVRVHSAMGGSLMARLVLVNHVMAVSDGMRRAAGRKRRAGWDAA